MREEREKKEGARRSLGDLLYIVYGGRCRQTCISNAIGLHIVGLSRSRNEKVSCSQ